MKARKHTEDEVLKALSKKNDVKIDSREKIVRVLNKHAKGLKNDLGNGSWGKIDYLVNHCGYTLFTTIQF